MLGAVMPGVSVEAASPALIEKVRHHRHGLTGPIQNPQSAAWHLFGHLHLIRLQHVQTGWAGADVGLHRDGQRRPESGVARGNGDSHRRSFAGGYPEHPSAHYHAPRERTLDALPTSRRPGAACSAHPGGQSGSTQFHDVGGVGSDRGEFGVHNQRTYRHDLQLRGHRFGEQMSGGEHALQHSHHSRRRGRRDGPPAPQNRRLAASRSTWFLRTAATGSREAS